MDENSVESAPNHSSSTEKEEKIALLHGDEATVPLSIPSGNIQTPSEDVKFSIDKVKEYFSGDTVKKVLKCCIRFNILYPYAKLFLRNKAYFLLFFGGLTSTLGASLTYISVITSIQDVFLKSNPFFAGRAIFFLLLTKYLPAVLLMPFTGIASDTFDRRVIMILMDFIRGTLVILLILGEEWIGMYYIVYSVIYSCGAFFDPARTGLIPLLVHTDDLVASNNVDSLCWMGAQMLGNFIGGLINSYAGPLANYICGSVGFFLSSLFIVLLFCFGPKVDKSKKEEEVTKKKSFRERLNSLVDSLPSKFENLKERMKNPKEYSKPFIHFWKRFKGFFVEMFHGVIFLAYNPYIFSIAILKGLCALNWGGLEVLNVRICGTIYQIGKGGSISLGVTKAVDGLSNGVTPFLTMFLLENVLCTNKHVHYRLMIFLSMIALAIGTLLLYLSNDIYVYCVGYWVVGVGAAVWSYSNGIVQSVTPWNYIGRVMAFDMGFIFSLSLILTNYIFGQLLDADIDPMKLVMYVEIITLVVSLYLVVWFICTLGKDKNYNAVIPKLSIAFEMNRKVDKEEEEEIKEENEGCDDTDEIEREEYTEIVVEEEVESGEEKYGSDDMLDMSIDDVRYQGIEINPGSMKDDEMI